MTTIWRKLFAPLFIMYSCILSAQNEAVITGKVDQAALPFIHFYFLNNPFTVEPVSYDASIDSATGVFAVRLRLKTPAVVHAQYNAAIFNLFVEGGDTLRMRFNGLNPLGTVVFEGVGASQNAFLTKSFAQDEDWTDEAPAFNSLLHSTPVEYARYIDRRYELKKSFFNDSLPTGKEQFTPAFLTYIHNAADYWRAYYRMLYYKNFGLNNPDPNLRIPDDYFDFTAKIDSDQPEALFDYYFLRYIDLWLLYRQEKETGERPRPQTEIILRRDKIVRYATSAFRLKMLQDPQTPEAVAGFFPIAEKAEYLNVHTAELYPYTLDRAVYYDQFYKIKTNDGTIGWIPLFGVGFSDEIITGTITRDRFCLDTLSLTCGFDRFIKKDKKLLYFLLAKNLLLPFATATEAEMEDAIGRYERSTNKYPEYLEILKETARLTLEGRDAGKFRLAIPDYCTMEPFSLNPDALNLLYNMKAVVFKESPPGAPASTHTVEGTRSETTAPALALISKTPDDFKGLKMNDPAPPFVAKDANGKEFALADFKGKVVYLDFWASWCGPCKEHIKYTQRLWNDKYQDKDVVFIYCSIDKNESDWKQFLKENNLGGVLCRDEPSRPAQEKYEVKRLPNYFLIDKKGKIQLNSILHGDVNLENAIDALLL